MPTTPSVLDGVLGVAMLWTAWRLFVRRKSSGIPLPPGPSGLPLLGSALAWPQTDENATFSAWGKQYGDIIHLKMLRTHMIILNSLQAALKMLDEKGLIYSNRPQMFFPGEIVGWKNTMIFSQYGPEYKNMRAMFAKTFGSHNALVQLEAMQEARAAQLMRDAIADPGKLSHLIRMFGAGMILDAAYGYQIKDANDEWLARVERVAAEGAIATNPGGFLVNFIPVLRHLPSWLPGMEWVQMGKEMHESLDDLMETPYHWVQDQLAAGHARPSFTSQQLDSGVLTPEQEHTIKWVAGIIYIGGAETTLSTAHTFFMCITMFPDVAKRAREELDRVVGLDRLPKISDRNRLPYIQAVVLEVLRWAAPATSGFPHQLREDDIYSGYFIPKGSIVIPNILQFSRDPNSYTNPDDFCPERFLGPNPEQDPRAYVFGFGRRVCPGRHLAEASLFVVCATALATLDIGKAVDSEGIPIEVESKYHGRSVRLPDDFPCNIKPRSLQAHRLLEEAADEH